ncbi:MAG: hypothetical protein JST32_22980, partial [Bacteroidetes bacterium]|nr:hypothetical protein [Bacteroidota bacterium]
MKKNINYSNLIVNPENYRFDPVDNQTEAIELMIEEKGEEIYNLAKHILENGLDQGRDTRVLKTTGGNFLVLDGNRRTTAIKCLHDPNLIKDAALRNKFTALLKGGKTPVDEINCIVYNTEQEAAEWIKLDHTGKNNGVGQDSWGPAEQDRFDFKFGGKLSPATQLFDLYTTKTGKQLKTKDIKISTINRILSNPDARSYIGVDINRGVVTLVTDENEALSRLGVLFTKIITDNVPVSDVYRAPQAVKFMQQLFPDKPQAASSSTSVQPGTAQKSSGTATTPVRRSLPKSTSRRH